MDIHLCFLPPYSPQLNPIEIIWKTMKRVLSRFNPTSRGQVESVVVDTFSNKLGDMRVGTVDAYVF